MFNFVVFSYNTSPLSILLFLPEKKNGSSESGEKYAQIKHRLHLHISNFEGKTFLFFIVKCVALQEAKLSEKS